MPRLILGASQRKQHSALRFFRHGGFTPARSSDMQTSSWLGQFTHERFDVFVLRSFSQASVLSNKKPAGTSAAGSLLGAGQHLRDCGQWVFMSRR